MELFFKALGYGLINSIWQMALLYGLFKAVCQYPIYKAAVRFRLGIILAFLGVCWFIISVVSAISQPQNPLDIAIPFYVSTFSNIQKWFLLISGIGYVAILIYAILKQALGLANLKKSLAIIPSKVPVQWRMFIQHHAAILEIKKNIKVAVSAMTSPATYGWIKPVILVPASCLSGMDARSFEALLIHELAHIKRNDYLWHLLLQIFETLLHPNPFMKLLIKETKQESEKACDQWVLRLGYSPALYAGALLRLAKQISVKPLVVAAQGNGYLLNRIAILLNKTIVPKYNIKFICFALLAFSLSALFSLFMKQERMLSGQEVSSSPEYNNKIDGKLGESIETPLNSWKQQVSSARISILKNRIGRKDNGEVKTNDDFNRKTGIFYHPEEKTVAIHPIPNENIIDDPALLSNQVFLNTNFTNNILSETLESESFLLQTKSTLNNLIEKLDEERDLIDKEWETLVKIITLFHELGLLMQQDEIMQAQQIKESKNKEVLLIIYDENTHLLTANLIDEALVKEALTTDIPESEQNQQKVLLLHRKKDQSKAEIRL